MYEFIYVYNCVSHQVVISEYRECRTKLTFLKFGFKINDYIINMR